MTTEYILFAIDRETKEIFWTRIGKKSDFMKLANGLEATTVLQLFLDRTTPTCEEEDASS
jgi:hypothetical protein